MEKRPNVLFVLGEDWGRHAAAYSADDALCTQLSTPHFDRIAREGALFLNARTPAPGCNPARTSIFTGQVLPQAAVNPRALQQQLH